MLAASLSPLTQDGERVDLDAVGPIADFLHAGDGCGILALGTTGEGLLLDPAERRQLAEQFVQAAGDRLNVVVHCGPSSTRDTVALAEHAARIGAAGVAVIGPPYFPLDEPSMLDHFSAAARACSPLPFFIYEFADRSGYAVPHRVIQQLGDQLDNLAGLKVSDSPWERFEPYLIEGLSIFVGPEGLIPQGVARGAVGSVSALAAAFPELVVEAVKSGTAEASTRCRETRDEIQRFPFHSAMKRVLARRGVPITEGVRRPLRTLTPDEAKALDATVDRLLGALAGVP